MMRVLISGVTSDLGRLFARAALGAGHEVVGVGAAPSRYLPTEVSLTVGDAAAAVELIDGCDVVVHLMPIEREVPESGGIPALRTLATACARQGIRFIAPLAHGPDTSDAERVVRTANGPHVVVRTAPLGGRMLDWHACRTIATLLSAPKDTQWRLLHHDDLVRFLLFAIAGTRTGPVGLAAPGIVFAGQGRELLRAASPTPSGRGIPPWPAMSTSDRKGSAQDWGFECGWTSAEVVLDLARGSQGRTLRPDGAIDRLAMLPMPTESLPRQYPPKDATPLASIALPSMVAELDDRIDPRFPVYSVTDSVESFPGPLTPLSLDVHAAGLRAANRALGRVMGLRGELADEWEGRGNAVFGHRMYLAVSSAAATAAMMPGLSEKKVLRRALDDEAEPADHERPALPTGPRRLVAKFAAMGRFANVARKLSSSVRDFAAGAEIEHLDHDGLSQLSDAALATRALLLRDRIQHGWTLSSVAGHVARLTAAPLVRRAKGDPTALGKGDLTVTRTAAAIERLAELLRADEDLLALADWRDLAAVRSRFPEFAAAFDEELARVGHRGPGETELANPTFASQPDRILAAAAAAAHKPVPTPPEAPKKDKAAESTSDDTAIVSAAGATTDPVLDKSSADDPEADDPFRTDLFPNDLVGNGPAKTDFFGNELTETSSPKTDLFGNNPTGDDPAKDNPARDVLTGDDPIKDDSSVDDPKVGDPKADDPELDDPEADKATEPAKTKRGILEKFAISGQRRREAARDATARYIDELRRVVREWGRRQVRNGQLAADDDAFYLTLDELLTLPADVRDTAARRRAEHQRLRGIRLPETVIGSWRPESDGTAVPAGEQLTGLGASPGVVEGRVRVVAADAQADLGSGEVVLVTRVADVGHIALFQAAAAVVTDLGDTMSHAAVVARGLGVPCVTDTKDASVRLSSGTLVRVDGTAGTVEVLERAPSPMRAVTP